MLRLGFVVVAGLAVASCKASAPASSASVKEEEAAAPVGACACNDLPCWQKKSDAAQRQSFQAAIDAAKGAASLAGGLEAQIATVGFGVAEIAKALYNRELSEFLTAVATGQQETLEKIKASSVFFKDAPLGKCILNSSAIVADAFTVVKSFQEYRKDGGFTNVASAWTTSADSAVKFAGILTNCLQAAGAIEGNENLVAFNELAEGWGKVAGNIGSIITAVTAGNKVFESGIVLADNTQCLFADLQTLAASNASVSAAADAPIPAVADNLDAKGNCSARTSSTFDVLGQSCASDPKGRYCADCCSQRGAEVDFTAYSQCDFAALGFDTEVIRRNGIASCTSRCNTIQGH